LASPPLPARLLAVATAVSPSRSILTASNRRLFVSQLGGPCLVAAVCLVSLCTTKPSNLGEGKKSELETGRGRIVRAPLQLASATAPPPAPATAEARRLFSSSGVFRPSVAYHQKPFTSASFPLLPSL
ncbi:hypothetical protein PIB30_092677, partial [Stylosanthes scabra]|nr:hypothetical protein [Stylosanthes scabra]